MKSEGTKVIESLFEKSNKKLGNSATTTFTIISIQRPPLDLRKKMEEAGYVYYAGSEYNTYGDEMWVRRYNTHLHPGWD